MDLKHKKPCDECPFRRQHIPGWLGGHHIDDFLGQIQWDGSPLPCHRTWEGGQPKAMCAGALIHMRNQCKRPGHPDYGDALDQVEPDTETVFQWPHEFRAHHEQDLDQWAKKALSRLPDDKDSAA